MTPADVLSSATLVSATFYGRDLDLGSIEPGKIADFVILNKNPLERIENTREIDAVVFRGESRSPTQLNIFVGRTRTGPTNEERIRPSSGSTVRLVPVYHK